jgi:transcriptional regulator with XRE-family HTH domain
MTEIYAKIGANVARIRKAKGFSQLDLVLAMGHESVAVVSLPEIAHKGKHFNIEHLCKIAEILGVNIREFFDGVD